MTQRVIRVAAYPLIFGGSTFAVMWILSQSAPVVPLGLLLVAVLGMASVAMLEQIAPYQREWLNDHGDLRADIAHALVGFGLLALVAITLHAVRIDLPSIWPNDWPIWLQVFFAGAVMDLGLYIMHRSSHRSAWLWRLHAIHHSSERLYWLNGERRHPLSAVVLASPGLLVVVLMGAPPVIVSAWLALLTVHLAFQHANLDYTLGPLRHCFGVAEVHRWHHKREYEDAQVNFGEFWMLWDHLFGTYFDQLENIRAGEIGLEDRSFPTTYWRQLRWPFSGKHT